MSRFIDRQTNREADRQINLLTYIMATLSGNVRLAIALPEVKNAALPSASMHRVKRDSTINGVPGGLCSIKLK